MKKITATLIALIMMVLPSMAQKKVTERDLVGTSWKLVLNVDREIRKEIEDEDNAFGRMILKSVAGFVEGVTDEVDVTFVFEDDNELTIISKVFGERDVDDAEWSINKYGELEIDSDSHISINTRDDDDDDDDDVWRIKGDRLVIYDLDDRKIETVAYLLKL